jgi:hypothetical protein
MSATSDRQALSDLAEQAGWQRKVVDRTDFYRRGGRQVEVLFTDEKLSGGTLYEDMSLLTHTRDMEKVEGWLNRAV